MNGAALPTLCRPQSIDWRDAAIFNGIGYRYFSGPDIKNNIFVGKNNLPAHFDNENHTVMVNLTIDTN